MVSAFMGSNASNSRNNCCISAMIASLAASSCQRHLSTKLACTNRSGGLTPAAILALRHNACPLVFPISLTVSTLESLFSTSHHVGINVLGKF
jgi:hypothetical protein